MPVTILVGERDAKFQAVGRRMADLAPHAVMRMVPGGHRLPLEDPSAVANALT